MTREDVLGVLFAELPTPRHPHVVKQYAAAADALVALSRKPVLPPAPTSSSDKLGEWSIHIGDRGDGGLRVWSDDIPGLILSGQDPADVMAMIYPAIRALVWYAVGGVAASTSAPQSKQPTIDLSTRFAPLNPAPDPAGETL